MDRFYCRVMDLSDSAANTETDNNNHTLNTIFNSITLCLVEVPWWLATAALVFLGPLTGFFGYGVALLVVGAIASMTITSLFSSWRGSIWIPQDVPAAILAITTVEIVSNATPYPKNPVNGPRNTSAAVASHHGTSTRQSVMLLNIVFDVRLPVSALAGLLLSLKCITRQ